MNSFDAVFLFLFIFSILIIIRELINIVFRLFQKVPKPKHYTTSNLLIIASSISYILTYIILK